MKLLNAVFSYNRIHLLRNTVESLLEFGPQGDLLIVDDGSNEKPVADYLAQIERDKRGVVISNARHVVDFHGGLYNNMSKAIDYARQGGYSYIFFIQDDVQFMWRDDQFLERVERILQTKRDAAMVIPMFFKGVIASSLPERLEYHDDARAWHVKPYGISDMGVMRMSLIEDKKWRFMPTENENGRVWRDWGFKAYTMAPPVLAWVPWPEVRFGRQSVGQARAPKNKYFLKPLSPEQIDRLKKADLHTLPYHEEYCLPWGWRCLSPYWFTKGRWDYAQRLWRTKTMPKFVGVS